jgi:exodeoxyribonuclease VII small subunit
MAKKQQPPAPFEQSLKELEALVERMEQGDLSLEESLQHFERGVQLTRACQQALKEAEQKVETLLKKNGQEEVVPFDSEDT